MSAACRFGAAVLIATATTLIPSQPANASFPGPVVMKATGFDACPLPPLSDMSAWWSNTNYYSIGLYLGGENVSSCGTLTHSYVNSIMVQGWSVWLLWVGKQSACANQTNFSHFSNTPSTAKTQGEDEATAAVNAATALGFANVYIIYDMEAYDTSNSTCLAAAESFVNGWEYQIHTVLGKHGAVYGSACGSAIDDYKIHSNVPEAIFPADYNNAHKAVYGLSCIPDSDWSHDQRVHQWSGGTPIRVPAGDPTYVIDEDCLDGPAQATYSVTTGCV